MFEVPISFFFFMGRGGAFFSNTLDLHGLGVRRSAIVIIISWCLVLKKYLYCWKKYHTSPMHGCIIVTLGKNRTYNPVLCIIR